MDFVGEGEILYQAGSSLGARCNVVIAKGTRLALGKACFVGRDVELGPDRLITIGDHTSIQDRCVILGNVQLGRYCVLSYDIYISSGNHVFDRKPAALIKDQDREFGAADAAETRPVIINDDVWLGVHVVVMAGVTIGRGAVVGANSVVTRSLPPYSVSVGMPARIIRQRIEFNPPAAIEYRAEGDIPYFYRGFETSVDERRVHASKGGHLASGDFALALKSGVAGKVYVLARSAAGHETVVTLGDRSCVLSDEFLEYEFDDVKIDEDVVALSAFGVSGGSVILASAWTA